MTAWLAAGLSQMVCVRTWCGRVIPHPSCNTDQRSLLCVQVANQSGTELVCERACPAPCKREEAVSVPHRHVVKAKHW